MWELEKEIDFEKSDVQLIMKNISRTEKTDFGEDIHTSNWKWIKKGEDVEIACCETIRISSEEKTKKLYPFILGDYDRNSLNLTSFVKTDNPKLFLMQPETPGHTWAYTWGVSRSMEARWGYIRSSRAKPCPTWAGMWMVFDKNKNKFVVDRTLRVRCVESTSNK